MTFIGRFPFKFVMYHKAIVPQFETQGLTVNLLENIIWYARLKLYNAQTITTIALYF
jgi:hypothetical protein